jgi:hypothetical protein
LYELGTLTPEESLELLVKRLGTSYDDAQRAEVADAVGCLPLALELAAARVKRGITWKELYRSLQREVAKLELLEGARRTAGQTRLKQLST